MVDERLVVELEARVSQWEKTLNKAVANLDQFAAHADRGEKAAAKFGKNVSRSLQPIDRAAAATGNQMRMLSFQINDIATGLATGQSPFMIMAQQGGQVYQILQMGPGGVGGSLRALRTELAAMITPTRLAIAGLAGIGVAGIAAVAAWESYALALDDLAKAAGTTSSEMSKLQAVASFKGIGQADFASGMKQFASAVYDARSGAGDLARLLRANNQTAGDTATTFERVADLVMRARDDQQRLQILQQAGLPATMEWVRLISQGAEGIRKAKEAAVAFGGAANDELIKKAREFDDAWNTATTNAALHFRAWGGEVVNEATKIVNSPAMQAIIRVLSMTPGELANRFIPETGAARLGWRPGQNKSFQSPTEQSVSTFGPAIPGGTFGPPMSLMGGATIDPNEIQRALSLEQQRINLLGDLATTQDRVRLKEIEIQQARLNGVSITAKEQAAILGLTGAQEALNRTREALGILGSAATEAEQYAVRIKELTLALNQGKIGQEQFTRAVAQANPLFGELKSATTEFASGFLQDIRAGTSAMDALGHATDRLIDRLIDLAANKAITSLFNSVSGGLSSLLPVPSAMGNVFDHGRLMPFASGGIITHPIIFPMARGLGLAGEAGPEAIMPLTRGPDGRLGVTAQSEAPPGNVTYAPTINIKITTTQGDREDHQQLAKKIAHYVELSVQKALLKHRREGVTAGGIV